MFKLTAGLRQVLAVDVLTGKAKQMLPDKNLRQPPEVEDQSILRYSCCLEAGCCSVHPCSEPALCCNAFQDEKFAVQLGEFCCLVRTSITQVCNMSRRRQKAATDREMCPCRAIGLPYLRYDSVMGTHPYGNVPVYITYHEACGYPRYLVTYTSTAS